MKPRVTKAVIAAAGLGTRFLPASKDIQKEMLPIVNVPAIHYVVKECIDSGITDIIIITRPGQFSIESYFELSPALEKFLKDTGKEDRLADFYEVFGKANIVFAKQTSNYPYGNGSPMLIAKPFLNPDEAFIYFYSDDVVLSDTPLCKQLIDRYEADPKIEAIIAAQEVELKDVVKYGIVKLKDPNAEDGEIDYAIEKPNVEEAPSRLATFGRYLLPYGIFNYLKVTDLGKDRELWAFDAIERFSREHSVFAHKIEGIWLTTGDPLLLLKANIHFFLRNADYKNKVLDMLKKTLSSELLSEEN